VGQHVVAGSHNLLAPVLVRVTQVGEDTQFSKIVALMENASLQKPRLALLADRVAKPFLAGVLVMAALAAAWWWPSNPAHALMVAVAVLVVTCPCALSLATPAAMLAAAGALARQGVLVRHLQSLEAMASIDTVIFDKTGTLTRDAQRIQQVFLAEGVSAQEALLWAGALGEGSLHPVSRVLVTARDAMTAQTVQAQDVVERVGHGLQGRVPTQAMLRLGSASFCAEWGVSVPATAGQAQVHLCRKGQWLASWQLSEDVREDAAATVAALRDMGMTVWVLSGDHSRSVEQVASEVGIPLAWGGCTPEDKLARLTALQAQGHHVAMVGDGLNDGPVLAGAHVSMAFGQAVPLAQSRSDLVLLGGHLSVVVSSLRLARKTLRVVRQNLAWAALYNAVCVPLAVVGWLPAWLAGLGMAMSSLWVVLNSLRLAKVA
jgi:Cu2+-exporting ATPase